MSDESTEFREDLFPFSSEDWFRSKERRFLREAVRSGEDGSDGGDDAGGGGLEVLLRSREGADRQKTSVEAFREEESEKKTRRRIEDCELTVTRFAATAFSRRAIA